MGASGPQIKFPFPVSFEAWHDHVTKRWSIKSTKVLWRLLRLSLKRLPANTVSLLYPFLLRPAAWDPGLPSQKRRPHLIGAEQSPRTSRSRAATLGVTCLSAPRHDSNKLLWGLTAYTWCKDSPYGQDDEAGLWWLHQAAGVTKIGHFWISC